MQLPNFLIIGAHKAGTSSLYQYLKQHPDVFMPARKELRYFSYDPERKRKAGVIDWGGDQIHWIKTWEEYVAQFQAAKDEKALGEASPNYLNTVGCAERIHKALPDVRLIASLRNPVDRAYSLYLMAIRRNPQTPPFTELLEPGGTFATTTAYYQNLKTYYDTFGRSRIEVILAERLRDRPVAVTQQLFRFLEVDVDFEPDVSIEYNLGGVPRNRMLHALFSAKIVRTLRPYIPEALKGAVRGVRDQNMEKPRTLSLEERAFARELFKEDIERVQDLAQVDLSEWLDDPVENPQGRNAEASLAGSSRARSARDSSR